MSLQALGYRCSLSMSLIVINPFSRYSSSTRRSFSTLFLVRMRSAASRLVSAGAVTRLSLVITSSIWSSLDSRNRRSRRVRMPRSLPLTVIGTPEMLCPRMISRAWPTVARRRQRDRVDDDPVLRPLDLVDLAGLLVDRHVLVDDAEAPLLRQSDGQLGLGDRVHRRRQDRDVERDPGRQAGPRLDLSREQLGVARFEQDVVEGDALIGDAILHREKLRGATRGPYRKRSIRRRASPGAFPYPLQPRRPRLARSTGAAGVESGEWRVESHAGLLTPHCPLPPPHSPLPTLHSPLELGFGGAGGRL